MSTRQRTHEWLNDYDEQYFDRQFENPYRSTVAFCNWLEEIRILAPTSSQRILDIGTGKGANVYYMAKRFPQCQFVGLDLNEKFVKEGNDIFKKNKVHNSELRSGDLFNLSKDFVGQFDGIVSYQTLLCLPDFKKPLLKFMALNPRWIALTSLFYEGNVNTKIEIEQYAGSLDDPPRQSFYNVYSIPLVKKLLAENGFTQLRYAPFEIDIDLPQPESKLMTTYTRRLEDGHRIQISGPLLMNWYFLVAERSS